MSEREKKRARSKNNPRPSHLLKLETHISPTTLFLPQTAHTSTLPPSPAPSFTVIPPSQDVAAAHNSSPPPTEPTIPGAVTTEIKAVSFRASIPLRPLYDSDLNNSDPTKHTSIMANYYDIDDILADEELVPAVFLEAVNGVGLFESNEANRIEPRSKVELPFWLARELHLRQAVSVSIPPCFNKKTREEIGADGAHVDLRTRCSYFYELGCKIVQLIGDKTIGSLLLVAFQTRYKEVLIKAHTSASTLTPKFLSLLTKEETKLYDAAKSSTAAFKTWRMGGPRFQRAAVLGRKRKPVGG